MKLVIPPIGYTKCIKMLPRFVRTKDTSRSFCTCGFCTPSHASLAAALQIAHGGGPAKGWINWAEPSKIIQRSRCKGLRSLERLLVFQGGQFPAVLLAAKLFSTWLVKMFFCYAWDFFPFNVRSRHYHLEATCNLENLTGEFWPQGAKWGKWLTVWRFIQ